MRGGLAIDVDVQTATVGRTRGRLDRFYESRRTLVIPSLQYRVGRDTIYVFAAVGAGVEFARSTHRVGTVVDQEFKDTEDKISIRGGLAAFSRRGFGMRADAFVAGWHVGVRVAIGYRFGD